MPELILKEEAGRHKLVVTAPGEELVQWFSGLKDKQAAFEKLEICFRRVKPKNGSSLTQRHREHRKIRGLKTKQSVPFG